MVFVKPAVRKSLLAKMLGEILDTRVMIKHAMKGARGDKVMRCCSPLPSAHLETAIRTTANLAGFDAAHECSTARSEVDGGEWRLAEVDIHAEVRTLRMGTHLLPILGVCLV